MEVRTNTFCSSGMHLPNGSYVTFGGNGAVGPGGALGSQPYPGNFSAIWDDVYQDFDGTKAIRILNPCNSSNIFSSPECEWYDDPTTLSMKTGRWYSAAEALADGSIIIIGGFSQGGYINRNTPNVDPVNEGGAAVPTYEYFPANPETPPIFQFLVQTSGLNAYVHTFLMPSGKIFVQANVSTSMCQSSISSFCNSLVSSSFVG
jgi:Glyoxal oxidase N-terminus